MTNDARDLYEAQATDLLTAERYVADVLNGLREHIDRIHFVISTVRALAPESVLDIACNIGIFGAMLRWNHGYAPKQVVGLDISPTNCEHAVRVMGYDRAVNADVNLWSSTDIDRADLVLCMEILEHLGEPWVLVGKALDAAKQHVLFSVPVEAGEPDGTYHVRKVSLEELTKWITVYGGVVEWNRFVESEFCEKPAWRGWVFVLAKPGERMKRWGN